MTSGVRLFGAPYSVYVRIVRMVLHEKGVAHDLVPVDVFADGGPPPDHLRRHPFGRIPAFDHAGFSLYETGAITRYVDEAFPGPTLQPSDPRARARCNQVIGIADHYVYPHMVWGLYVERVAKPARGEATDEAQVTASLSKAGTCVTALADLLGRWTPWFAGEALSLADLALAPMVAYAVKTPEGRALILDQEALSAWWSRMSARRSFQETVPD